MVITLPRIKIQHLPRFPIPKIKLLAGERTTTGYYEADNNVKNKRTWKPNSHVNFSFFLLFTLLFFLIPKKSQKNSFIHLFSFDISFQL